MKADFDTGTKTCGRCRKTKTTDEFYPDQRRNDGLRIECRTCTTQVGMVNPSARLWYGCKRRALRSGLLFTISKEDIVVPRNCPVCTCKMVMGIDKALNIGTRNSPSVDRYDPQFGYVPGNVWVICWRCNMRKQDMSGEDHIIFGQRLIEARQKTVT